MSVARSYARALLDIAQEQKMPAQEIDRLEQELIDITQLFEQKDLRFALYGPAIPAKEKVAIVTELSRRAQSSRLLGQFLVLLARKERLSLLPEVRDAFGTVRLEAEGGIQGRLVSADPMNKSDVDAIASAFSKKLGKKVAFQTSTDSSLLAGMKVTVSGITYDGTLRSQLQRLRDQLVF